MIEKAENVKASSAFSFAQTDIDHVLRLGGNAERQRVCIVAAFEKQKSNAEIAAYLQTLCIGGSGVGYLTAWYAEDGIHLSLGRAARYDKFAQVISWESAAERIGQLLKEGQFASNVELAEAEGYERTRLAEQCWNLYHDFSDKAREDGYLTCLSSIRGNSFPQETEWLAEQLKSPEFRQTFTEEYTTFWTAYQQDRELLRFHHHNLQKLLENLQDLSLPRITFSSQMTEVPVVKQFITEDEIDAAMARGSSIEGGKGRIFTFFQQSHTDQEKAEFLKHEYGIGGRSHALSGAMRSDEQYDANGLCYKKADCPDVHFTWEKAAKRITGLIQKGRYLTEQEQAEYEKIQEEKALADADAMEAQQPDPEDNVDPIAIREALAERGIVNGQLVDPEKLDNDPFVQQVMADAEQIAAKEAAEPEPEQKQPQQPAPENFRITDDSLGTGGPKEKFWRNTKAIAALKQIERENRRATPEEQHILSQYVGWGGLPDAFDPDKPSWAAEYSELKNLLTESEYASARSSTLNAHYTSPTVIKAIYDAVGTMGFQTGNILEIIIPSLIQGMGKIKKCALAV